MADKDAFFGPGDLARFSKKYEASEGGCWLWTAGRTGGGYGRFTHRGRHIMAHRFAFQALRGPIPDGLVLDHLCRNRACVNPDHLEPVTLRENTLRGEAPSALNSAKSHCKRGHELTPDNVYIRHFRGGVTRECRTCNHAYTASRRARFRTNGLSTKGRPYRYAAYISK